MDKFRSIYSSLFKKEESFIDIVVNIINELEPQKDESYKRNLKYTNRDYICCIIEVLSNNVSWRKYNGKIDGRVLNNKHNYYSKLGVYERLCEISLENYQSKDINKSNSNYQSIDSSFVSNKYGTEEIGRNTFYKNKNGRKITALVDEKGIPLKIDISRGNTHDAKIAPRVLENIDENKSESRKYILGDKGYDSKKIREVIRSKKYKPLIPKRRYKGKPIRSKEKYRKHYKKRIVVENFIAWIKMYPKIDKVYEKTIKSYTGLLYLGISVLIYKKD